MTAPTSTSIDTRPADRLLRLALRANPAFSGICGITALLAAGALAASLGIADERLLPVQGVSLVGFSGLLAWLSARPSIRPGLALAIVAAVALIVHATSGREPPPRDRDTLAWRITGGDAAGSLPEHFDRNDDPAERDALADQPANDHAEEPPSGGRNDHGS